MGSQSDKMTAFIPARGGSKSIPLKNIAMLAGRPLLYWVCKACSDSESVEAAYVGTDSDEIRRVVEQMRLPRVHAIGRSGETATDTASSESALIEFAEAHPCEHVALIQATSPLLTSQDIDGAMKKYVACRADSLLTVVCTKRFFWEENQAGARPVNYDPLRRPRRQSWDGQLVENGALYITRRQRLLDTKCRISGRIVTYEMPPETYYELDESSDWLIIENLLLARERFRVDLAEAVRKVRLFCVDVDGTLTDAGMYYTEAGEVMKRFNTRDAAGMVRLRQRGIIPAIVTAEDSPIVLARARKLAIEHVHIGVQDKERLLAELLGKLGLQWENLAYVGDDVNDLPVICRAGFSACPSDAEEEVARRATYVCRCAGGRGAVREVCNLIEQSLNRGEPRPSGGEKGS